MVNTIVGIQFVKMLNNLNKILNAIPEYADAKKFEPGILLNARLAPNQFNLIKQVQIACDTAKLCASRLSGKDAPSHDDSEATLPELKSRIESTISYLESFSEEDFTGFQEKQISQPRWEGKHLMGDHYLMEHAIPNFYFHVTTAFAILRHNGLDIGKKNYLGEMPFKSS